MKLSKWIACIGMLTLAGWATWAQNTGQKESTWSKPAADLASQIAEAMGPGQAHLAVRNLSSLQAAEIPAIRKLLVQELKSRGVLASGVESANSIQVTLSEDLLDGLWVAEINEGSASKVVMIHAGLPRIPSSRSGDENPVTLRAEDFWQPSDALPSAPFPRAAPLEPAITMVAGQQGLWVLTAEEISVYQRGMAAWQLSQKISLQSRSRDARGVLAANGSAGFVAYTPGTKCTGDQDAEGKYAVSCAASDDPWPIAKLPDGSPVKAFYNASRNSFTGVITPGIGVDLPPFYSLAVLERANGPALLVNGIDGKVLLAASGTMKPVSGARDWGSDFVLLHSGCPAGDLVIASSSGEATEDSLRAYRLPGLEAQPVSAPLAMHGSVTSLWHAEDGKSLYAVVRKADDQQEVVRVTALCN
jgi:hypothetical protein